METIWFNYFFKDFLVEIGIIKEFYSGKLIYYFIDILGMIGIVGCRIRVECYVNFLRIIFVGDLL